MTYLIHKDAYAELISEFMSHRINVDRFIEQYIKQWCIDRDEQWIQVKSGITTSPKETALCEILDQIFTACDCYNPKPKIKVEINESQLRSEIGEHFKRLSSI